MTALSLIVTIILFASSAFAQKGQPPDSVSAAETGPAVVAPADLVTEATVTSNRLLEIRASLEPHAYIDEIETELPKIQTQIDELRESTEILSLDAAPSTLEAIRREWSRHDSRLESFNRRLSGRIKSLEKTIGEMGGMRDIWQRTLSSAVEEEIPESLIDRIKTLITEIDETEALVKERLNNVFGVQNRVAEVEDQTNQAIKDLDASIERAQASVFSPDRPPIWKAFESSPDEPSNVTQLNRSWEWTVRAFAQFVSAFRRQIIWHGILLLVLIVVMYVLRARSRGWDLDDQARQTVKQVFYHPTATALLIALLVGRLIYKDAPLVVLNAITLLSVPTLAVLVPRLLPRPFLKVAYFLFAIVILFPLTELLVAGRDVSRGALLAVSAFALTLLIPWLKAGGPIANLASPRSRANGLFAARSAALLFSGSVLANVFGLVSLADLLVTGTLVSAYYAVLTFISIRVLDVLSAITLDSRMALSSASIRNNRHLLKRRVSGLLRFAGFLFWSAGSLRWFGLLNPISAAMKRWFSLEWPVGSITISIQNVAAFVVTLWVSILVSRLIRTFLKDDVLPRAHLARGMPQTISLVIHYAIITIGFVIALAAAGFELSQLAILAGAFGVGIGFGLQTVVNNFISGLILIFERPINVGDTIQIGTLTGVVRHIGIRASNVRTFSGAEVIVPNGNLLSGELINWTLSDQTRRVELPVGVAYGSDPNTVLELLVGVAKEHDGVLKHPEPSALFQGFGESSLDFELRFWAPSDTWFTLKSEITVAVNDALKTAGIEIPFPQRDLHVRSVDTSVMGFSGPDVKNSGGEEARETTDPTKSG